MKFKQLTCTLSAVFLALSSQIAFSEQKPVDCSTAKDDLAHLKHEKKSTDERVVKGALSILPIGLVINATHEASTKETPKEMEINKYNQKISDRMDEIKKACNIQ